jgi:hypothetical protein
VCITGFTDAD